MEIKKFIRNIMIIIVFTILSLFFILKDNFNEILFAMQKVNLWVIIIVLVFGIIVWGMQAYSIKSYGNLFKGGYSFRSAIINSLVAGFFCGITPSASGGQIGQVDLMRHQGFKSSDIFSILWLDFISYQIALLVFSCLMIILKFDFLINNLAFMLAVCLGFAINFIVVLLLVLIVIAPKLYLQLFEFLIKLGYKFKIVKDVDAKIIQIHQLAEGILLKIALIKDHPILFIKVLIVYLIRFLLVNLIPVVIILLLDYPINLSLIFKIIALSCFVGIASSFIPIPGASGYSETLFILIFSNLYSRPSAIIIMLLWRFASFYSVLFTGAILYIYEKYQIYLGRIKG